MKIRTAEQPITARPLVCILFGAPGAGKTSTSFTGPGKVLHIDADRGIDRAEQKCRPDYVSMSDYANYGEWHREVMTDAFASFIAAGEYKTIVLDTAAALLDDFMATWLISSNAKNSRGGGLSLQGWGELGSTFAMLLARLRSLGLHVVIIAHEKQLGDEATSQYGLAVKGGSNDLLLRMADIVGYQYLHPQKGRVIDFTPNHVHIGKNTAGIPETAVPTPDSDQYDTFLGDIIQRTQDKMTQGSKATIEAKAKVEAYITKLGETSTADDYTALITELGKEPSKSVKAQIRTRLMEQMKMDGFEWSKDEGKVVAQTEEE